MIIIPNDLLVVLFNLPITLNELWQQDFYENEAQENRLLNDSFNIRNRIVG